MKKIIVLIFLTLIVRIGYACDCKEVSKDDDYERSSDVFIGEIISINENYISDKVIENFKGNLNDVLLIKKSSCSISPELAERWLIYSNGQKDLDATICGWSRNLERPENSIHYLPAFSEDENSKEEIKRLNKMNAILELDLDLKKLRDWKKVKEPQTFFVRNKSILVAIIITSLLFLIIFLFIKNQLLRNKI